MTLEATNAHELDDDEFDALEELLTSDVVPADCMNLEMLDGYIAGIVISPMAIPSGRWLPGVWTAHGDDVSFASGSRMQRVIRLVLRYYNELVTTIGASEGWEPFCYAATDADDIEVGEEWIEGFMQGLELWPQEWDKAVPEADAAAVKASLENMITPWERAAEEAVSEEQRLELLALAHASVNEIFSRWRALDLPPPSILTVNDPVARQSSGPGRNELCACGSGKKYKKCCGAA